MGSAQLQLSFAFAPRLTRARLEHSLRGALGLPVRITLTDNRRAMISSRLRDGRLELRMHRLFLEADRALLDDLVRYLRDGDPTASRALSRFVAQQRHHIRPPSPRRIGLKTDGQVHDLRALLAEQRAEHVPDAEDPIRISWAKRGAAQRRARRPSLRLGTYVHDLRLIRIHPVLDQDWVPRFFVAFVVFHELLHHVVPPAVDRAGRVHYHTAAFRRRERAHPDYPRATAWETEEIDRLLATR